MNRKFFTAIITLLVLGGTVVACYSSRARIVAVCAHPKVQLAPVIVPQVQQQVIPAPAPVVVQPQVVAPPPVVVQQQVQTIQVPVQTVQTVQVPVQTVQLATFAAVAVPVCPVPFLLRGHLFPRAFPFAAAHNAAHFGVY